LFVSNIINVFFNQEAVPLRNNNATANDLYMKVKQLCLSSAKVFLKYLNRFRCSTGTFLQFQLFHLVTPTLKRFATLRIHFNKKTVQKLTNFIQVLVLEALTRLVYW